MVDIFVEMPAHGRMNAVCRDQNIRLTGFAFTSDAINEMGRHAAGVLLQGFKYHPSVQAGRTEPLLDCLRQEHLQGAAVNGVLRYGIAGSQPTRLVPDLLPELIVVM